MNISEIVEYTICERRALRGGRKSPGIRSAAALVGTMTHARLVEVAAPHSRDGDESEPVPERIAWDSLTPSFVVAEMQAWDCAEAVWCKLQDDGWGIVESECEVVRTYRTRTNEAQIIRGRYDLLLAKSTFRAIAEIKTGVGLGGWLQLGGYLGALDGSSEAMTSHYGMLIHVPRTAPNRHVEATLTIRDAHELTQDFDAWRRRIAEISTGAPETASPGIHCAQCSVSECGSRWDRE